MELFITVIAVNCARVLNKFRAHEVPSAIHSVLRWSMKTVGEGC